MNQAIFQFDTSAAFGLHWPTWLAGAGVAVFCLLGIYAGFWLIADQRILERSRFLLMRSLRGRIMLGITLASTLPAISLALVLTERTTSERLERTADLLRYQATNIAQTADYFLYRYFAELETTAADIDLADLTDAARIVDQAHRSMSQFLSLMIVDDSGRVIAATPFGQTAAESLPNDAEYVRTPLSSGTGFFSGAMPHPDDPATTTVAISAPIGTRAGRPTGLLIGFYNLDAFERIQGAFFTRNDIESVLVDRQGRVLHVSKLGDTAPGMSLSGTSLLAETYVGDENLFAFNHADAATGTQQRFLSTGTTMRSGWRLFLIRPLDSIESAMFDEYGVAFAWLCSALIISVCLALAMVSGISGPLEALDRSVREFDLDAPNKRPTPPPGAPQEVRSIFDHLGELDKRMRATYGKLRKALAQGEKLRGELIYVIANREKEIEKRTEELQEANATLERLSREDSLTGLANRRWFAQFLVQTWRTALRDHKAVSILIMDIDDFKAYNDSYGHQKGDDCLKRVAEAIRRTVGRASDLVSRYGGEEFVVVLGDTPLEGALRIAEQIRAAVEQLAIPHRGAKNHRFVTVSIGVTSTLPTHDTQPETVLIAADRAMYNAKNDGKNCVAYSTAARTGTYQSLVVTGDAPTRLS